MWLVTSSKGGVEYSLTHSFVTHMNVSVDFQLQCFIFGALRGELLSFSNLTKTQISKAICFSLFSDREWDMRTIKFSYKKQHNFFSLLKFLCKILLECHS